MKSIARALLAGLAVLALASCGRSESAAPGGLRYAADKLKTADDALPAAPSAVQASVAAKDRAEESAGPANGIPAARMVIKTAALSVKVKDVDAAYTSAVELAERKGGYVQSSSRSEENGTRAEVSLRIPPEGFLPLLSSLEGLGEPIRKDISGQDVTEEYFDLKAELENEREVRARLFELLKKAATVKDAILVETELERVGAVVNRIVGRMKFLETMVGMSTVDLTLFEEATYSPVRETFLNWSGVARGFWRAAQILVEAFFFILQSLVVLLPLAAVVTAVVIGIRRLLRARRARKAQRKAKGNAGTAAEK